MVNKGMPNIHPESGHNRKSYRVQFMQCEECGEPLLTNHETKDRHRWIWCRSCGLVIDPEHPQGRGISGLMAWLRVYGVKKTEMQKITKIYTIENLKSARLASIPIVEEYFGRQI